MVGRFPREEEGAGSGEKSAALFGGPAFLLLFRRFFSVVLLGSVVFKRVFLGDTFLLLMSGGWVKEIRGSLAFLTVSFKGLFP